MQVIDREVINNLRSHFTNDILSFTYDWWRNKIAKVNYKIEPEIAPWFWNTVFEGKWPSLSDAYKYGESCKICGDMNDIINRIQQGLNGNSRTLNEQILLRCRTYNFRCGFLREFYVADMIYQLDHSCVLHYDRLMDVSEGVDLIYKSNGTTKYIAVKHQGDGSKYHEQTRKLKKDIHEAIILRAPDDAEDKESLHFPTIDDIKTLVLN